MFTSRGSRRLLAGCVVVMTFAIVEARAYGVQATDRVANPGGISIAGEGAAATSAFAGQVAARARVRDHRSYNTRAGSAGGGRGCSRNGRC